MAMIIGGSVAFSLGCAFLKASEGFTRPGPTLVVALCFLAGAAALARQVMRSDLSSTIVLGLGIEALATLAIGVLVLGERLSPARGIGVLLVLAGVTVLRT